MNQTNPPAASDNPFCTRRIRPGALRFIFSPGHDAASLVERLQASGWWGQIIGPHGSGKSTLLETLLKPIEQAGRQTVVVTLHDQQRQLPLDLQNDPRLRPPVVLIVDGYEQLSYWSRWLLKRFCRRQEVGLLVTAHKSVGLPSLYQTAITSDLAQQVVGELLDGRESPFTPDEVSLCLTRHGGDLRETLFDLYDLYQQRHPLQ